MRGWLRGFNPFISAGGMLALVLTPVAAVQAGRYWAAQAAVTGALGFLMLGLARRYPRA